MKIAVDCDEVLAGFHEKFMKFHNDKYGTLLSREDFHTWSIRDITGETFEEERRKISEFLGSNYFKSIRPIPCSLMVLKSLKKTGFEMEIITSRPKEMANQTLDWVEMHYRGIFSGVHFSKNPYLITEGKSKGEICKEIGADFMIEDDFNHARDVASRGISVLLYDAPWNKNRQQEKIKRVYSWKDIGDFFK